MLYPSSSVEYAGTKQKLTRNKQHGSKRKNENRNKKGKINKTFNENRLAHANNFNQGAKNGA